jgi:hypothetical protein
VGEVEQLRYSAIFLPGRLGLLLAAGRRGRGAAALLTAADGIATALEAKEFAQLSHQFD